MLRQARPWWPSVPDEAGSAAVLLWRTRRTLARHGIVVGLLLAAVPLVATVALWPRPVGAPGALPSAPLAVAAGPGGYPFVATADGRVWALDPAGPRPIGAVGGQPVALAADPLSAQVYVATAAAISALGGKGAAWRVALPPEEAIMALAADAATDRVYAAAIAYDRDRAGGHLLALDARTGRRVADVLVGTQPLGLALDPRTHRVYLADGASGAIVVLAGDPPAVRATLTVGGTPAHLAVDARAGRLYVTDGAADTLAVLDAATGTVRATVPLGIRPADLAVDPATGRVFVADDGTGTVAVLASEGAPLTTLHVGARPAGLVADPAGGRLYVTDGGDNGVWRIEDRRVWGPTARLVAVTTAAGVSGEPAPPRGGPAPAPAKDAPMSTSER